MKNFGKSALALMATFMIAAPAHAVTTISIVGTVFGGAFDGATGSGTVTYDDSLLDPSGDGVFDVNVDALFEVEFTIFGQTFTAADDIDAPSEPSLVVVGYFPEFLDFIVSEDPFVSNPVEIDEPGVFEFTTGSLFKVETGVFETELDAFETPPAIPLPATLPLFGVGLGLFGLGAVRRRKQKA